jgi:hypothetical protein
MFSSKRKFITGFLLPTLLTAFLLLALPASQAATAHQQEFANQITPPAYLELSVEPSMVNAGELVTLHIAYHNLGFPYTLILIDLPGLVAYEPPLSMPCKYDQHPNGCTAIPFRALTAGVVTFTAAASGEVYDEACQCRIWTGVTDNGPATVIIADKLWQVFIPLLQR